MSSKEKTISAYMGLAALMRLTFEGQDLGPVAAQLIQRAQDDPQDANALMDLATTLELNFKPDIALATQAQALQMQSLYRLPAATEPGLRLLSLMAPGDLTTNAPLAFLLEESDVALDMLYVGAGVAPAPELPEHDVLFVAVGESEATHALLEELKPVIEGWPRPVLNPPGRIMRTSRDGAYALLHDAPGIVMPPSLRIERADLERLGHGDLRLEELLPGAAFPLIVRPVDSHAGHDLAKLDAPQEIAAYLADLAETRFFLSPFMDYRDADGLYRKYRVVLIGGRAYAGHMGISDHWMIHYLNAGMRESAAKRAEEARFMERFEEDFARRHAAAIEAINQRLELDYLVIDCAETESGELLIFEVDTGAIVHSMDPSDLFPYKLPAMRKVFEAFRALLAERVGRA
jgi:glutathione synthase/RimK-type ligase-like ATP-grasp enzyme